MSETRVVVRRGDLVECVHRVRVAVVQEDRLVLHSGDVESPLCLRSAAKPVQALACVLTGAADRFSMSDAELALACGSHSGEPFHVSTAAGLLERIGLGPDALQCGAHPPIYGPAAEELVVAGEQPAPLHNNCSGKHAAMLAACVAADWDVAAYLAPDHPLQVLNRTNIARFGGIAPEDVRLGTDGCSVPTLGVPLRAAAQAVTRLTNPGDEVADDVRAAAERVLGAVARRPEMIGGTGRLDSDVLRVTRGRIVTKVGAEGVWIAGVRGEGVGLALKCEDGAQRGRDHAGLALLRRLDLLTNAEWGELEPHHDPVRRNHRGIDVGTIEVVLPGASTHH